jgi:hypothetical protein
VIFDAAATAPLHELAFEPTEFFAKAHEVRRREERDVE